MMTMWLVMYELKTDGKIQLEAVIIESNSDVKPTLKNAEEAIQDTIGNDRDLSDATIRGIIDARDDNAIQIYGQNFEHEKNLYISILLEQHLFLIEGYDRRTGKAIAKVQGILKDKRTDNFYEAVKELIDISLDMTMQNLLIPEAEAREKMSDMYQCMVYQLACAVCNNARLMQARHKDSLF